ncbi:hypothetical protein KEM55_001941 [Ascosphaera atra]|nr:hypothetical protein KEM55_001941 [Ascosphaera atra]
MHDPTNPFRPKRVHFDPTNTACEPIVDQNWNGETVKNVTWGTAAKTISNGTQRAALAAQASREKPPMPCTYCQANVASIGLADVNRTPRKGDKPLDKALARFEAEIADLDNKLAEMRHNLRHMKYVRWQAGDKEDPKRLSEEGEMVVEYFETYGSLYDDINNCDDRLRDNLLRIASIKKAMAELPFAVEDEETEAEGNDDEDDDENEIQARRNRATSRQAREDELAKTPGRRKRTIVHISGDDSN